MYSNLHQNLLKENLTDVEMLDIPPTGVKAILV